MGQKGTLCILLTVVGLLLPSNHVEGQEVTMDLSSLKTTWSSWSSSSSSSSSSSWSSWSSVSETTSEISVVNPAEPCVSYAANTAEYCSALAGISQIDYFLEHSLTDDNACSYDLMKYSCASIEKASNLTVMSILKCFLTNPMAITSQQSFSSFISKLSLETLADVLYKIDIQIPASSMKDNDKLFVLNAVWDKIRKDPAGLCTGFPGSWFQKLSPFLSAIHTDILNCMTNIPLSCDGFQAVVDSLHLVYGSLSNSTREKVGHWISEFLHVHSCSKPSAAEWIQSYYRSFKNNVNYKDYIYAWSSLDVSSALDVLTEFQVAQYCTETNVFSDPAKSAAVLQFLRTKDIFYMLTFLDGFAGLTESVKIDREVLFILLQNTMEMLAQTDVEICKPSYKEIFQMKIQFLLAAVNETALQYFPQDMSCSDFLDVSYGLDKVYNNLAEDSKLAVFSYRLKHLLAQFAISGSGCGYGISSSVWLANYFGVSSSLLTYSQIISLNPSFNGFSAISLLTINQTLDLFLNTNILVDAEPVDFEIRISAFITYMRTKGYEYLKEFLIEFRIFLLQFKIVNIENARVRCLLFDGIWGMLTSVFPEFTASDWHDWFNEYLPIFLPCINKVHLAQLTTGHVKDCSNFQAIIVGLNKAFDFMSEDTKLDIVSWIESYLNVTSCASDNWLIVNWQQFRTLASISVLKDLNPDFKPLESLNELTAGQMGEVIITEKSAQTDVHVVETIFDAIVNIPSQNVVDNLGLFWDKFNFAYQEVDVLSLTEEVKYTMLNRTTIELSKSYSTFTEQDYSLWFENRLNVVATTIDSYVLNTIPLSIPCTSFAAVTKGLNLNYFEMAEKSKTDVYEFIGNFLTHGTKCDAVDLSIKWINLYFGNFSQIATYEQIITYNANFNPYEPGVLQLLTSQQIGDMIVFSNTWDSYDKSVLLFKHLQTLSFAEVDICFTEFTQNAIKKNINIESVEVGHYMLLSYFQIIQTQIQSYTHEQIIELFEKRISLFIKFFTLETLSFFSVRDCDTLVVIVAQLDKSFDVMPEETKQIIASWLVGLLKGTSLKGCFSASQSQTVWIEITWKRFFVFVTLQEVMEVNSGFNAILDIDKTSVSQKADFLVTSNALVEVETVKVVLESLKFNDTTVSATTIFQFLTDFNVAYEKLTIKTMSNEVQVEMMTFLFKELVASFKFVTVEQMAHFQIYFKYFLSGITVDVLKVIPMNMGCTFYSNIFSGFSSVYDSLSEDMRSEVFKTITGFLEHNSVGSSGEACGELYSNSKTYITNIFFKFSYYATFYDLSFFYSKFNAFEVLDKLSGKQLGNLLMNSTAIRDQMLAVQILVELEKRDSYEEVTAFMTECNRVAEEKQIVTLPNSNIEFLIFQNVWKIVSQHLKTSADYSEWFGSNLKLVLSSMPSAEISMLSMDIDCRAQKSLVAGFSSAFKKLEENQRVSVFNRIKDFQNDVKVSQGSSCYSQESSGAWVDITFGEFKQYATIQDFKELNTNFSTEAALPSCTGAQIADYVITSGALQSEQAITTVFESLDTTEEISLFYEKLNKEAPVELKNSPEVEKIVEFTFEKISDDFSIFTEVEWTEWFQVTLKNVLFAVNETELDLIPSPLPCAEYQQMLKGFNNVADSMTEESKKSVYEILIKPQFSSTKPISGVVCGANIKRTQEWLDVNFGVFEEYAEFTDITKWNNEFSATEVISSLSVTQLAEVSLDVKNINNEEIACQIVGQFQDFSLEDAYKFWDQFSLIFTKMGIKELPNADVSAKFLSGSLELLKKQTTLLSLDEWKLLLSVRIKPFLRSITKEDLDILLSLANCDTYPLIVTALNDVFDDLLPATSQALYASLYKQLSIKFDATGYACSKDISSTSTWLSTFFGKFKVYAFYGDLVKIYPSFNGLEVISDLTSEQLASLVFSGSVLTDASSFDVIADTLKVMTFSDINIFLGSLHDIAVENSFVSLPNNQLTLKILNAFYPKVSNQFAIFSVAQWKDYFYNKLNLFLGYITVEQINLLPNNVINCDVLKIIVSAMNDHFSELSDAVRQAFYQKIKGILQAIKNHTGSACGGNTPGSVGWLNTNLASFSVFASYDDIIALNPDFIFTDAVSLLSAQQLAWYCVKSNALRDSEKIEKIMSGVNSHNLGDFLDTFNLVAKQNNITQLPNIAVGKVFSGAIFCVIGSGFTSFTSDDYDLWFNNRLKFFISGLNVKTLGSIPTDISCDKLAILVKTFSSASNIEDPSAIYKFLLSVLQKQLEISGNACSGGGLSDKVWMETYLGAFSKQAEWSQLAALNPSLQVVNVMESVTINQLAIATASSSLINNVGAISGIFESIGGNLDALYLFISTIGDMVQMDPALISNLKVKDTMLMETVSVLFPKLESMSIAQAQKWITDIDFLLTSINGTMLDILKEADVSCPYYQLVIAGLNKIYFSLSALKQKEIYDFIKYYLTQQYTQTGAACPSLLNIFNWITDNMGLFCRQSSISDSQLFYPGIDQTILPSSGQQEILSQDQPAALQQRRNCAI